MQRIFTNLWDLDDVRGVDELRALIVSIHDKDPDFFRDLEENMKNILGLIFNTSLLRCSQRQWKILL